jgi:hypothetical protein
MPDSLGGDPRTPLQGLPFGTCSTIRTVIFGTRTKDSRRCYIAGLALMLYAARTNKPHYAILSVTSTSGCETRTVYARVPSGLDLAALPPAPAGLALGAGLPLAPGLGIGLASASPGPPSSRRAPSRGTSVYSGGRSTTSTLPASSCLLNWVRRGESSPEYPSPALRRPAEPG